MQPTVRDIPYYRDYISDAYLKFLLEKSVPVTSVDGLTEFGQSGGLETPASLSFLCAVYEDVKVALAKVLEQRTADRLFIDKRKKACCAFNKVLKRDLHDSFYDSILGQKDASGRVVMGPLNTKYYEKSGNNIAPLPEFLKGPHITTFGLSDSETSCFQSMNAYNIKLPNEPKIIQDLLENQNVVPKWGVDSEDSTAPLHSNLLKAAINLQKCFNKDSTFKDPKNKHVTQPFKRIPGLAIPCNFLFYKKNPIPLHLYDFLLHLFALWHNPEALVFYVPKLENEEEAIYLKHMIYAAERRIKRLHPEYVLGTVRIIVTLENSRAIFRVNEIMDELFPYFAGASLGWHDYLASTARLYKQDSNYRIPLKSCPTIVITHIKASHELLTRVVGGRGGICIGGMYGVLPITQNPSSPSFQVSLRGYIKDVISQLKRGLVGFWVARSDFVRMGLALVEAWKQYKSGQTKNLETLIRELLEPAYHEEVLAFVSGPDIVALEPTHPLYPRALIVANVKEAEHKSNNDPEEIRYNVFQSLQYITGWLGGNACITLPGQVEGSPVHIMDDLATVERSRWSVWHEVCSGRFPIEDFLKICHEELRFIQKDLSDGKKIVEVKWNSQTAKWYPIALELLIKFMSDPQPVEFVTELLLPFSHEGIHKVDNPLSILRQLDPHKFGLEPYSKRFIYFFEQCSVIAFAKQMAQATATDLTSVQQAIYKFDINKIIEAASFHGDIGHSKRLNEREKQEQAKVYSDDESVQQELRELGAKYLKKFGFKYLVSAHGRSGTELLALLKERFDNTIEQELSNAREALWQITKKRVKDKPADNLLDSLKSLRQKHDVVGASLCITNHHGDCQTIGLGESIRGRQCVSDKCLFEISSMSKAIATAFSMEYFAKRQISLDTPVNQLLEKSGSSFRLIHEKWADQVQLKHLMNHSALNVQSINGIPLGKEMPTTLDLLKGNATYGYEPVGIAGCPGKIFKYSASGFLVLQHLIEMFEKNKPITTIIKPFLDALGIEDLTFDQNTPHQTVAFGYDDQGNEKFEKRMIFPTFAAGGLSTPKAMITFLRRLVSAYYNVKGSGPISHDTAVLMLYGTDKGSKEFINLFMGMGLFIGEAGPNHFAVDLCLSGGFRGISFYCFDGPDVGAGTVIFANGEKKATLFIIEAFQKIIRALDIQGIDMSKFTNKLTVDETPMNSLYKESIFCAFQPTLPAGILNRGPLHPLASFNLAKDAEILSVSNQRFALASNVFSNHAPVFDPKLFCPMGKVMDSWETARHNTLNDELVAQLKQPASIHYVLISTKYHLGNQVEFVQISGRRTNSEEWIVLVSKLKLKGHAELRIQLEEEVTKVQIDQVKLEIFPDGGLSRIGLYGANIPMDVKDTFVPVDFIQSKPYDDPIPHTLKPLQLIYTVQAQEIEQNLNGLKPGDEYDAVNLAYGGSLLSVTNQHFGPASQILSPYIPLSMHDGFESARSRSKDHHEELIVSVHHPSRIHRIDFDFSFFVNNNPKELEVFGYVQREWIKIVPRTDVKPWAGKTKEFTISSEHLFEKLKIAIYPDGGINRMKAFTRKIPANQGIKRKRQPDDSGSSNKNPKLSEAVIHNIVPKTQVS